MNTKHTPAPWTVNPKAKRNVRHGNLTIANCSSSQDGSREEEEIANAKLIAAAPELLEALKIVRNYFGENDKTLAEHKMFAIADNAIKKATE